MMDVTQDRLARAQGIYYLFSGAWPLVSMRSFEAVLGVAATFALVDAVHALRGRISRVYLVDAALEAACVAAWVAARHQPATAPPSRA